MVAVVHVPVVQGAVRVLAMAVVVEVAKALLPNHSINKKRFVMKQKKTNEELQSRREFFKKASKAALPVVGAVIFSAIPNDSFASSIKSSECQGCTSICTGCTGCSEECGGCTGCTGCSSACGGCTSCTGCTGCSLNCYGEQY